jgi:flagellar basal body rod protein FlgG
MSALERMQDVIGNNIANSGVSGFKATGVSVHSSDVSNYQPMSDFEATLESEYARADGKVSFEQGMLVPSDNPMDCAIDGKGFFQVEGEEGTIIYTRSGRFHLNTENELVDASGRPVVGDNGAITAAETGEPIRIEADGQVYQGGIPIGRLTLVDIANPDSLTQVNGGFRIMPDTEAGAKILDDVRVVQGFYEASNVSAMREMVGMIEVSRAYEANERVISTLDGMMGRANTALSV